MLLAEAADAILSCQKSYIKRVGIEKMISYSKERGDDYVTVYRRVIQWYMLASDNVLGKKALVY